MTKKTVSSLWGDFDEVEDEVLDTKEVNTEEVDTEEVKGDKVEPEKSEEPDGEPEKTEPEKKEEVKDESDEDPLAKTFDEIAEALEIEELLFLDDDKEYDASPEGFKAMLKDNMSSYQRKLAKEFEEKEASIRKEYESKNKPRIADMDPSNEGQAQEMLKNYYSETGFTEDEIKDKLAEVKDLDNWEKEARIAQRYLSKKEKEQEELEAKAEERAKAEREAEINNYINSVKSEIDGLEEISGFQLTPKLKKDFKNYLFEFDKEGKTPAQRASTDSQRRLRLAFLDFMDFNKKDFEIKVKTELAKEYTKKTSRFTSKQAKSKGATIVEPETKEGLQPGFLDFWQTEQ